MPFRPYILAVLAVVAASLALGSCRGFGFLPATCNSDAECPFEQFCVEGVCSQQAGDVDAGLRPLDGGDEDAGPGPSDAGDKDAGHLDGGFSDAGRDGGSVDAGEEDAGLVDGGVVDAGEEDAGLLDAGVVDAGDAGVVVDAGVVDAGVVDAGVVDAGVVDAGVVDAGITLPPTDYLGAWPMTADGSDRTGQRTGEYQGSVFFSPGVDGQAAYFFGPNAALNCTSIGQALSGSAHLSMSAWVRDDDVGGFDILARVGHPDSFPDFATGANFNFMFFDLGNQQDTFVTVEDYATTVSPGRWHHWAVVFDGTKTNSSERAKIYIDGIMLDAGEGQNPVPTTLGDVGVENLYISSPDNQAWSGFIDEFRLYRRSLSGDEVAALANEFSPPYAQDYRFFLPFEGNARDVTQLSNPPTIDSDAFSSTTGVIGSGARFDGGANEHLKYVGQSWLSDTQAMSVSMWVEFDTLSPRQRQFFLVEDGIGGISFGVDEDDSLFFEVSSTGSESLFYDDFSILVERNEWFLLTAVYDGSRPATDRGKIYFNGTPLDAFSIGLPTTGPSLGNAPWTFGNEGSAFRGSVDEVMLFDRALSRDEIVDIFNARNP